MKIKTKKPTNNEALDINEWKDSLIAKINQNNLHEIIKSINYLYRDEIKHLDPKQIIQLLSFMNELLAIVKKPSQIGEDLSDLPF